jgi:ADP-ribose pyrophosphatase YjhB (NUDIX family)
MNYQYCPRCGSAYSSSTVSKGKFSCTACGLDFYINPKPCNGLFLKNTKGEILLIKRRLAPDKGKWDVLGGFVDLDENVEESAIREAKEELQADITDVTYLASYTDTYNFQGMNYPTLVFMLSATIQTSELQASDDAEEYRFFPPDEIPWDDLAFTFLQTALKDFLGNK